MSMPPIMYSCDRCDFKQQQSVKPVHQYYRLDNGLQLPVFRTTGWCFNCNEVQHIEDLSVSSIQHKIEHLETTISVLNFWDLLFAKQKIDSELNDLKDVKDLFLSRVSNAKCLHCGCVDIINWGNSQDKGSFCHPGCEGKIKVSMDSEGIRFHFAQTVTYYSSSGKQTDCLRLNELADDDLQFRRKIEKINRRIRNGLKKH